MSFLDDIRGGLAALSRDSGPQRIASSVEEEVSNLTKKFADEAALTLPEINNPSLIGSPFSQYDIDWFTANDPYVIDAAGYSFYICRYGTAPCVRLDVDLGGKSLKDVRPGSLINGGQTGRFSKLIITKNVEMPTYSTSFLGGPPGTLVGGLPYQTRAIVFQTPDFSFHEPDNVQQGIGRLFSPVPLFVSNNTALAGGHVVFSGIDLRGWNTIYVELLPDGTITAGNYYFIQTDDPVLGSQYVLSPASAIDVSKFNNADLQAAGGTYSFTTSPPNLLVDSHYLNPSGGVFFPYKLAFNGITGTATHLQIAIFGIA